MADDLRGDGLVRVHRALDRLEADPLRLDRARMRFSQSPPTYTSNPSGTTTRSASPDTRSDEQRRRERRRYQLIEERAASLPQKQFEAEVEEERKRSWYADPRTRMHTYRSIDRTFDEDARKVVKKRWIDQGIWKNKWENTADGLWKHEEPLELESELEMDTETASPRPFSFGTSLKPQLPKPRQPKSDYEKQRIAERRAIREQEREASRPYHQFIYQISKERERTQDESANGEGADAADINTRAYENVKNTWTKRGIWNRGWGILPGMSWKHESPLEEEAADDPTPVPANPLVNGNQEAGEASAIRIFGSPSLESNQHQASSAMNSSQQRPFADIDSAGSENGGAERSPSTQNSPPHSSGKRVLRPTRGQASQPSKRIPSHKDEQPARASLGPIHSSRVAKASGKRKGPHRRSQKVSSNSLPLSCSMDAAEPQPSPSPDRAAPRRSKRIQPPVPSISKDPTRAASTNLSKRAVRSTAERNVASSLTARSSAKPQGISKKQPAKLTRGRAREKINN